MYPYKYRVSLRVKNERLNLDSAYAELSNISGVIPGRLCNYGEPRKTPTGIDLPGQYNESWFSIGFTDDLKSSNEESIEMFLEKTINKLIIKRKILTELANNGSKLVFFIGLFINKNSGIILDLDLIKGLKNLGIGLEFDVYPPDKLTN